jgi:Zn-dependent peptidase ImmA (M78 family)
MKLPKELNIKGAVYSIKHTDDFSDSDKNDGLCDFETKTIYINNNLSNDLIKRTLIHECFHAVMFECGIHCAKISEDLEEIIVENLSNFLIDSFIIRNK